MLILDRLSSRVDVSLSLTVSNEVVAILRREFQTNRELLVASVSVASLLSLLGSSASLPAAGAGGGTGCMERVVGLLRRLSVLVISELVLTLVRPTSSFSQEKMGRDLRLAMGSSMAARIPLTAIQPLESFVVSSCLIVLIGFLARAVARVNKDGIPELQRLSFSIQYLFADIVARLLVDRGMLRIVAIVGLIGISPLAAILDQNSDSQGALHVWISGVAMAWVNIIVSLMVPDVQGNTSPFTDIVGASSLLLSLQALTPIIKGLSILSGYVEWHLSTVVAAAARADGASPLDIILGSGLGLACIGVLQTALGSTSPPGSAISMSYGVLSLVAVNTAATLVISTIMSSNPEDGISAILATLLMANAVTRIAALWRPG